MYFKQIEMIGFKSFADRTVVNLEAGMTSVVGPNGCGKSNILDAMRWALGEQSAKMLRGTHMQDIIFNGSEERAPTGMAEVTLTFDNSDSTLPLDFAEVQVTRRIFRSGESEYLINKAPCRLRDIQELFMDTGIGTNAYSMIGQGRISQVLSSKPEDRRALFEEAAGIVKYKSRKRIALRKLDQAEQNILRLGDIVAELQRQMRSLKRQVNAAIRYREFSDELRELEIRAAWIKHRALSETIAELREKFEKGSDAFEKDSTELSRFEARNEKLSLEKLEVDRVLHARREGVHEIDVEMEKIERQIALIRQQAEFSAEQQRRSEKERAELIERAQALEAVHAETTGRLEALQHERVGADETLEAKTAAHERAAGASTDAEASQEAVRAKSVESMNIRAKNQTEIETLSVTIINIEAQLTTIYERQGQDNRRSDELTQLLEERRALETERQTTIDDLQLRMAAAVQEEEGLAERVGSINEEWRTLRERKSSVEARLASLRELRDSYEGFAAGVRAVMLAKREDDPQVKGVIGPIADLISTGKTYERAIEAALGGRVNNVPVENADAARRAIDFLKERRAGRVTFLPLDIVRAGSHDDLDRVQGKLGVIGPATQFLEYEPRLQNAIRYLFHNTVIVQSIDDALRIARELDRYPRLVTIDGEVISSSGAVTGGRTRHDSGGLIGRSAEIGELEEQSIAIDKEIGESLERARRITESLETVKATIAKLTGEEEDERTQLSNLGVDVARLTTELDNLSQARAALEFQREELANKREPIEAERRGALERATKMDSEEEALQREIADAQEAASRAKETQAGVAGELSDLRVTMAGLAQTLDETRREQERIAQERETVRGEDRRRSEAIEGFKQNRATLENDTKDQIEQSKALSETKEEARHKVVEAENQRQGFLDESEVLEKSIKEVRDRSRESQATVHQVEIELRHNEDQLEFFRDRIRTEYNLTLSSIKEDDIGTDDLDEETREQKVDELRTKLDRMGPVNLTAIDEYETLTERHDFLEGQEKDLRTARDTLLGIVARIDTTIKDMFLEVFKNVSESFHGYFRQLFNGGHARIYLLDEDDPLECGIEIEARPPGKKLQSITLLSGGEQAMTAIGLLFSLFNAKRSPFCILDEVDAPLDDANIGRFLSLLDQFTDKTQFIVITHNKQTMARADALYGVTMQERGVSQLVSVRFDEVRESAEPAA